MLAEISHFAFIVLSIFCELFDAILLWAVLKTRFISRKAQPWVYIAFMTFCGLYLKFTSIINFDALPIANMIDPVNGYENFRQLLGKPLTMAGTHSYLTPVCLNFLMTVNRVWILLKPFDTKTFSEFRLFILCSAIWIGMFISLFIPFLSSCSVNYDGRVVSFVSACAPNRHPITLFQNKYSIYVPYVSMVINFAIILRMKWRRMRDSTIRQSSLSQRERENIMLRQAAAIASYLSVYECTNLFIRIYPEQYLAIPGDIRTAFFTVRLLTVNSLNFFVYFIITKSTRQLVLNFLGIKWKKESKVVQVVASQTLTSQ